ncbi:MAG: uroporphyrinogen decarboxylase family protein [Chloroflexia bacterium]
MSCQMPLTPRERVRRALAREPVDRLPTQVNVTAAMTERLSKAWGISPEALAKRLGNHLLRLELTFPRRRSSDGRIVYDWWGVGWSTETEGYWPAHSPLAESKDLDRYLWPDPYDPHLLDDAASQLASDGGQRFALPNFGFCLFERAWTLRGFERFLLDLVDDPEFAEALLERIAEIQLVLARRFLALGVDGGYFGDDYGAQKGLLFSPRLWRKLIKPRLARLFAVFREAGLPVILHSDGDIAAILPDLVEIGLCALNPVQPEVLDLPWLRRTFGHALAFYGGVSSQTVLPHGSPEEVRAAVRACRAALAPEGTGLILAPSHRLTSDIPLENVEALLAAFQEGAER